MALAVSPSWKKCAQGLQHFNINHKLLRKRHNKYETLLQLPLSLFSWHKLSNGASMCGKGVQDTLWVFWAQTRKMITTRRQLSSLVVEWIRGYLRLILVPCLRNNAMGCRPGDVACSLIAILWWISEWLAYHFNKVFDHSAHCYDPTLSLKLSASLSKHSRTPPFSIVTTASSVGGGCLEFHRSTWPSNLHAIQEKKNLLKPVFLYGSGNNVKEQHGRKECSFMFCSFCLHFHTIFLLSTTIELEKTGLRLHKEH